MELTLAVLHISKFAFWQLFHEVKDRGRSFSPLYKHIHQKKYGGVLRLRKIKRIKNETAAMVAQQSAPPDK